MRRMSKPDIKQQAMKTYRQFISYFGLSNGKKIVWEIYKMFRDEGKRRKELKSKERQCR